MEMLEKFLSLTLEVAHGLPLTLFLTVTSVGFGLAIGTFAALGRLSKNRLISSSSLIYIALFRGTPLLVQLYFIYYGMGQILADSWIRHSALWPYFREALWYAVVAFSLNQGAYNAEILRGTIQSLPKGQWESARAIGMKKSQILRRIILPQAYRVAMPLLVSDGIIMLKSTSLASTITIYELLGTARRIGGNSLDTIPPLVSAALIYLIVVTLLTALVKRLEIRMGGVHAIQA